VSEDLSKMNFYLNAVDEQLRLGDDRESVGDHPLLRGPSCPMSRSAMKCRRISVTSQS